MANDKNSFDITGVIYKKSTRLVPNKKKPTEPDWEFKSMILEVTTYNGERSVKDLPEFQLANNVGFDEFSEGDLVNVRFCITGKSINPTWHKTELKANFIKFADISGGRGSGGNNSSRSSDPSDFMNCTPNKNAPKLDPDPLAGALPEMRDSGKPFTEEDDLPF